MIIQALVDGYAPKIVCTIIGVCVGDSKVAFTFDLETVKIDDCSVCKLALGIIKDLLGESFTQV